MEIKITDENIGKRCDVVLLKYLHENGYEDITRSFLQNNWENLVKINGKDAKVSFKLRQSDILEFDGSQLQAKIQNSMQTDEILAQQGPLDIIFENNDFIILNKPSGIVIHPGVRQKENTLANYVVGYLTSKGEYDRSVDRGGIVHRLDKGVSGLVIFAKTLKSQKFFQKKFENHDISKVYLAEVNYKNISNELREMFENNDLDIKEELDALEKKDFVCDDSWYKVEGYIHRSRMNRMKMRFGSENRGRTYRYSLTYVKPLNERQILVKIETGRMHQIRASLEYLRMNIIGDTLYESLSGNSGIPEEIALKSILLSFEDMNGEKRIFRL